MNHFVDPKSIQLGIPFKKMEETPIEMTRQKLVPADGQVWLWIWTSWSPQFMAAF